MNTDYILFLHGVNTRQHGYSNNLFNLIQTQTLKLKSDRTLRQVELYWGDINNSAEDRLRKDLEQSKNWHEFWFKDFRLNQLLQFAGDGAPDCLTDL